MIADQRESTYRIAEQTNRCGRFAKVTVVAVTGKEAAIDIANSASANEDWRAEAVLGAGYAMKHVPTQQKAHVTVTAILGTQVDTLPGTVFEATVRAVWQALNVPQEHRSAGMNHRALVHPILATLCGRQLEKVVEARHWYDGHRDGDQESLIHFWLYFGHFPPLMVHGCGDHVQLAYTRPYASYSTDEYGETRVEAAEHPDLMATFVGATLLSTNTLHGDALQDHCSALVLRFDTGNLVLGTVGDEWVISREVPDYAAPYWTSSS